ncbi:unnamed protein product [Symbiodinium natans]|uniref:Pentatricopeptide repeat-containing protein, chloroplastic n=1 Tax=Symbiodinium natans TaxID=878477 RepID=A0A812MII2_9DINO|nr:unnamed protein product [Symbiodinium natans]
MERRLLLRRLRQENVGEWGLRATLELCWRFPDRLTKVDDVLEVLAACRRLNSWELALAFWARFHDRLPHVSTANVCIPACAENGAWRCAIMVFESTASSGLELDISTHNAAASAASRALGWQGAIRVVQDGGERHLRLDAVSLNTVAGLAVPTLKTGVFHWTWSAFCVSQLFHLGVLPDAVSFTSATVAAARSSAWCQAAAIAAAEVDVPDETDGLTCSSASVLGLSRVGLWDAAARLAEQLRVAGEKLNTILANGVLSACENGRCWRSALCWASDVRHSSLTTTAASAVLSACGGSSVWDHAVGLIQLAQCSAAHDSLDAFTYSAWISSCSAAGLWEAALRTWGFSRQVDAASVASNTAGLAALGRAQQWRRMLDLLAASGLQPASGARTSSECFNAALQGCYDSQRWLLSLDLLTASRMLRCSLDRTGSGCFLRTCGTALLWMVAADLLDVRRNWPPVDIGDQTWNANCWACEASSVPVDWPGNGGSGMLTNILAGTAR